MDWLSRVRQALPRITGDFRHDAEVQEELAEHCASRQRELEAHGTATPEAERLVMEELAATVRRRRALHSGGRYAEVRSFATGLQQTWQDVRYAGRLLVRTPTATLASVATLALTIGATTAIFSVVQAVLLRPLPYAQPEQLVRVYETSPQGVARNVVSGGNYLAWAERTTSFDALGTFRSGLGVALTAADAPAEKLVSALMTASVLDVLRVTPLLGPGFTPGTFDQNLPREVLLSHGLWQRRFNGDPDIIGQTLTIDGASALVVGVMPATFAFPEPGLDIWFANRFQAADRDSWTSHNHNVIARLTANADIAQASHELSALATTLAAEHPAEMTGWGVNVVSAHADAVRTVQPLLTVLAGVVGVVLLIACANLATLQLARTSRRHVEMAVRAAIGAGRGRLVRQLLTETLLITGLGGAIGLGVLAASLKVLLAAAPPNIPFIESVAINGPVLGFAVAVTLGCGLLVGLVPALLISRGTVRPLLASTRTTAGGAEIRWRHLLVAAQVGLTLVLLITSGLLVQSVWKLQSVDHGFDPSHLLTVSIDLPSARYPDNASQHAFYATLLDQLAGLSGVVSVAGTSATPATGANMTFSYAVEGRQAPNPTGREDAQPLQSITPGYFRTMGIPVLEGRGVDPSDQADAPGVIVINHALAIRHWPTGGAVGARLRFRDNLPWLTIVGVVADTHDEGLDVPSPPTIYVPFTQRPDTWRWLTWQTLMLRTVGDPLAVLPSVRTTVWEVDRDLPILEARTMNAAFAQNDARRRFAMSLSGAFAILALGLAAIGIVGVLSCAMAERRKEIGIRLALGASPTRVASAMMRSALIWTLVGLSAGAGGALLVTRFLQALLFNTAPSDPLTFAGMAVLLLAVASAAAWWPAQRAVRTNALTVLRDG